jgi:hypothetical protein
MIQSEMNLTPTNRASRHTTSQLRFTLASVVKRRAKLRGNSAYGCAMERRAPPSEMSQISQWIGLPVAFSTTAASRRIRCRFFLRYSRF